MPYNDVEFQGSGSFQADTIAPDASAWTNVALIPVGNREGRVHVTLLVEDDALTHLKVTRGARVGDHHAGLEVDIQTDAELNTATVEVQNVIPLDAYVYGPGVIQMILNADAGEYGIWAKSAAAGVTVSGKLPKEFNN